MKVKSKLTKKPIKTVSKRKTVTKVKTTPTKTAVRSKRPDKGASTIIIKIDKSLLK